jgi:hypothetical protein
MTLVDVDNTAEPLTLEHFSFIKKEEYPYCLIGFYLKNSYDQERIRVKAKYKACDVIHVQPTSQISASCFRGVKLKHKQRFNSLIAALGEYNTSLNTKVPVDAYKKLLGDYGLTCDECYLYLKKGIYPIDGKCLQDFSDYKYSLEELYADAFNITNIPYFQSFSSFTIFILCDDTIYSK